MGAEEKEEEEEERGSVKGVPDSHNRDGVDSVVCSITRNCRTSRGFRES